MQNSGLDTFKPDPPAGLKYGGGRGRVANLRGDDTAMRTGGGPDSEPNCKAQGFVR